MNCKFKLDKNSELVSGKSPVKCSISLESTKRVKDIKSICYGIAVKINGFSIEDADGIRVSSIEMPKDLMNTPKEKHLKGEIILKQHDLLGELSDPSQVYNCKLYNDNRGNWFLPANEPTIHELEIVFPTKLFGSDLPSSKLEYINGKSHNVGMLNYLLYVKVVRETSFFKRSKIDMFYKELIYTDGNEVAVKGVFQQSIEREFLDKHPKPMLIDDETGCFKGDKPLCNGSNTTDMMQRFIENRRNIVRKLNIVMTLEAPKVIDMNKGLFNQLQIMMTFDVRNFKLREDFESNQRSTGLGLFEIESLTLKVIGKHAPYLTSNEIVIDTNRVLVFDMKDCDYKGNFGTMEIGSKYLIDAFGDISLGEYLKIGGTRIPQKEDSMYYTGHSTFQLIFQISDCDQTITFPFINKC